MEFRILGPLQVTAQGRELNLGGRTSQRIAAALLLNPNRVVTMARLEEAAWDADPPATSRRQLQNRISYLRRQLTRNGGVLETHDVGYRLRVGPDELDAMTFARFVGEAHGLADRQQAYMVLRSALALWRGPALAGLGGIILDHESAVLEERRLATLGDCLDLELALGKHHALVPELRQLVTEHPLRERFVGQWMVALCRSGRRSEALDAYQHLRRRLVDELGVEPGPELRHLHQTVLRGEAPAYSSTTSGRVRTAPARQPSAPLVPRQLPADVTALAGRERELSQVESVLTGTDGREPIPIVAIQGAGGVGKSALAIHAAHRLAARFPHGQLYIDLQGATPGMQPLPALDVLGRFLRALGVDGRHVPTSLDEAAARYRSEIASRRLLVLLDNASDAAQVAPLLPGSTACAVLITSRRTLNSLECITHLQLTVLSTMDAVMQLTHAVGTRGVADDPAAAADVAHWCGCLPLALRIAGARLAARPTWPLRNMAARLANEQRRLDELELPDVGVRASLAVSHQALSDSSDATDRAAAAAFVALSLLDGPDVGLPVAARLLDQPEHQAERVLERLVDAALLESPSPWRYRSHDLLRLYAREQAPSAYQPDKRVVAVTRAYGLYVATAWRAFELVRPGDERPSRANRRWSTGGLGFSDAAEALDWLETERSNLIAAVRQSAAAQGSLAPVAIELTHALFPFFRLRGYWAEAVEVNEVAVALASEVGDRQAQAMTLGDLGAALCQQGRYKAATDCLREAIGIHREMGDRYGQAQNLNTLGVICQMMGQYDHALFCYEQSQAIHEELSNPRGQAMALDNLGPMLRRQGRYDEALACHERAIAIFRDLDDRYGQAVGMTDLGLVYTRMGRYDDALTSLQESLAIYKDVGDRYGEAEALTALGVVHRERNKPLKALAYHEESLAICRALDRRDALAATLRERGLTLQALGRRDQAQAAWREAADILEELQSAEANEVRALLAAESQRREAPAAGVGKLKERREFTL